MNLQYTNRLYVKCSRFVHWGSERTLCIRFKDKITLTTINAPVRPCC